jgi:two-component system copper resistance phosphate regulon response regulator CusR
LTKLLLVESDELLADFLRERLAEDQFEVRIAQNVAQAKQSLEMFPPVMILDLDLPEGDGLPFLQTIRGKSSDLVIVGLVPGGDVAGCVKALEAGADDCLVKPFSYVELTVRIRAVLRRRASLAQAKLVVDDLVLDRIERTVQRGRQRIVLTEKEFALLEFLMERPCQPVSRDLITGQAWEFEPEKPTNLVAVYINYLRKKIDTGFDRPLIQTIRGVGYQIGQKDTHASS